jgi:hypothetical protein
VPSIAAQFLGTSVASNATAIPHNHPPCGRPSVEGRHHRLMDRREMNTDQQRIVANDVSFIPSHDG